MAAGQTVVSYNGVTLTQCLTRRFEQEAVYDESQSDLQFFKFTVRVVGYVHGVTSATSVNATPNPGGSDAAAHHKAIRYLLGQPRGAFVMRVGADSSNYTTGGTVLLQANGLTESAVPSSLTNRDVNNGPKPRVIDITEIAGNTLMRVEFEIEVNKIECDANGACPNSSGVLNNRWMVTDDVDQNFYTTRTFTGRLRVASSAVNANSFRSFVVPPLQPGMRRDSMQFTVTTDGLNLEYTVVDREVAFSPPAPATTWSFRHSERVEREGQLGFYSTVQITLGGDRNCDKKKLIAIAASIAEAKLLQKANRNASILHSIEVTDEYSDNSSLIHLSGTARRVSDNAGALFGLATGRLGKPIDAQDLAEVVAGYDRNFSRGARTGENIEVQGPISLVGAFAAYLQTPCNNTHAMYQSQGSETSSNPPASTTSSVSAYESESLGDDGSLSYLNEDSKSAAYTFFQMESNFVTDQLNAQCPIAKYSGGSTPDTNVVVRLSGAVPKRIVTIQAERNGERPVIPYAVAQFSLGGITYRLLNDAVSPGVPEYTALGSLVYRVRAEYVYAMSRPIAVGDTYPVGVNPYDKTGFYTILFSGSDTRTEDQFPIA